jgi:FAD/FMN-containing dehydrogenase
MRSLPLLLLLLAPPSLCANNNTAQDTCATVERAYPNIEVVYPYQSPYWAVQSDYWNKACQKLNPSCIILPTSTGDVAKIIDVLSANQDGFAIKGGGHMPNCGFASVERGPLIALARMKRIEYSEETQVVSIGPGNRWHDVMAELGKQNRSVVGGRVGHVGVSGYMLVGGPLCSFVFAAGD